MAGDEHVLELLLRWESLRTQGKVLTAEELCPDDPALHDALRARIQRRLRLDAFLLPPTEAGSNGAPPPLPQVPGYEILEVLGQGGMGIVYKARQVKLDRVVALKMMLAGALPTDLARFKTEAEAVARLRHANIVQIYEVGEHAGRPYLVLEYAEGGSLAQHLQGAPLPPRAAAALLLPLADAVAYAHGQGVVHRDLKPANILLASAVRRPSSVAKSDNPSGHGPRTTDHGQPKVADFGLAKRLDSDQGPTQTGAVLGTPAYMSPEQAIGRRDVGPATDVYALGVILYELLTGRPPFVGSSALETLDWVRELDPVPPGRLQPGVPHDLEVVCLKCLHKSPRDRYAGADALAADLRAFLDGEPIRARSATALEQFARAVRHHRLDERVAALGNSYLWGSPVFLLAHLAAYALWGGLPRFPEIIALVTTVTVLLSPVVGLLWRPGVDLLPLWLRRRMYTVWPAEVAASLLAELVFWLATPAAEPERLLLVYPVWLLLAGLAWFGFTDLLGIYHVCGAIYFTAAVLAALLPFWGPLATALAASLNFVVIGLFMRAVHRAVAREAQAGVD